MDEEWERYGRALIEAMHEVLAETSADRSEPLLETADYWLSIGLAMGLRHPPKAERLLALIERQEDDRRELEKDAASFLSEVIA